MEMTRKEKPDIGKNFRIVEALYEEAVALGVIPSENPLEGLDVDIRIARILILTVPGCIQTTEGWLVIYCPGVER
jgi:hypothetical protein